MGIIYKNSIPYGGGGDTESVELTQAEYDALSTEEKMNGTVYFITDGEGGENTGIPMGGTTGQALVKKSNSNYDVEWSNAGGSVGPEYAKVSVYEGANKTVRLTGTKDNTTLQLTWSDANDSKPALITFEGEGINQKEYSIGNTNSVELTQAEYDALTQDEKLNGTAYFISDSQSTSGEIYKSGVKYSGGGNLPIIQKILWETTDYNTNPATITLSDSIMNYDMIYLYGWHFNQKEHVCTTVYLNDIWHNNRRLGISASADAYIWYDWVSNTELAKAGEQNFAFVKVVGISFGSKLDGTIGRWEKIGEWINPDPSSSDYTEKITIDLSEYNAVSFNITNEQGEHSYDSTVVPLANFEIGDSLNSRISFENVQMIVQGNLLREGEQAFQIHLSAWAVSGVLYGYKETGISDADVQRIAQEVKSIPNGGTTGQVLTKKSNVDQDIEWKDVIVPSSIVLVDTTKGGYNADDFAQYVYSPDKILVFYDNLNGAKVATSGEEEMECVTFYSIAAQYSPTIYTYTLYRDSDTWSISTRQLAVYHRSMGIKNSILKQETVTFSNPQTGVVNTTEITSPFLNDKFLFDDEYTVQLTLNGKSADPSSISKVATYAIPEYNKLSICVVPEVTVPEVKVMWSMITDHTWKNFWSIYSRNSSQTVTDGWSTANFSFYSAWKWQELYDYLNNYNWRCLEVIINYNGEIKRNVAKFTPIDGWFGPTYQYPVENEYGSFLPIFWEKNDPFFTNVKYFAGKDGDEKMYFTDATDHDPAIVNAANKTLQGTFNPNTGFKEREDF